MIDPGSFRRWLDQLPLVASPDAQATLRRFAREIEMAQRAVESAAVLAAAAPHIPKPPRLPTARPFTVHHLGPHSILTTAALHGWSA